MYLTCKPRLQAEYAICNDDSMLAVITAVKNHAVKELWCFAVAKGAKPVEDPFKTNASSDSE